MRKSRFMENGKSNDFLSLGTESLGGQSPQDSPPLNDGNRGGPDPLGEPLSIREVASLIGVSVWTVRQRYLPAGLPHFRCTPEGKLLFYKTQIINWLLTKQQKGGTSL
jgi:hypothetical protein